MATSTESNVVEHASPLSFEATVKRLLEAIEHAGLTVFATIDHAANARAVGMTMPPAAVLIYGNGKGGTPIMLASPHSALDLPLRALVQEREGRTVLAFHPIAAQLQLAGVPEELASRLQPAQQLLVAALQR